jgi:enoyl-CoA hydratase/carnithine racemase
MSTPGRPKGEYRSAKHEGSPASAQADAGAASGSVSRFVTLDINGPVAEVGLNSGALNLVNKDMLRTFNRVLGDVAARADVRCLILHGGKARAFCAGSDIKEFEHLRHDASEHKILFEDMVLRRLARMPMPTIAALDGPALGGGLEIALACDLRVCRRGVALGLTESRLGGLAGNGSIRLARLIGPSRAKDLLFTGETIQADQALAWGLVNRVASEGTALDAARELAATIAARGPVSNRLAKKLVDAAHDMPLDAGLSLSTVAQQEIFDSGDLHEGVAAFFAKRPPVFAGK